jgi:uncharacterized protein YbbC (DUF1343 family)
VRLQAAPMPRAAITLGDEVFLDEAWRELKGRCVGVVTNQTGVTSTLVPIVDAIRANPQICIKAIFAPEHGLRGDRQAGAYVASYNDERSGLPVFSLYGSTRHPSAGMLAGVSVLLIDLQDVGARPYTYASTVAYVMQAAKENGKEVWVLDRPNPIGADIVEGPVLEPRFESFIGLYPIAMRHGMTIGELAQLYNGQFQIGCNLRVIKMRGYSRSMQWPQTGLGWIPTSPNIPDWSSALVYPATGLVERAGINNGTGYTDPFKVAGTAGIDADRLSQALNARPIPGVHFTPTYWTPSTGFWAFKTLRGVLLVITDPRAFRSVRTAVEIMAAVRDLAPNELSIHSAAAFDRDWGTDRVRLGLEAGSDADTIVASWQTNLASFVTLRARYLLY